MVRACCLCLLLIAVAPGTRSDAQEKNQKTPDVKIGLLEPMFKDVPEALVQAGAIPFQKMIQEKTGIKGSVELVTDYKILASRMKDGKIDIAVFHGFEYAWVKETPGLVPLVVTMPNCGKVQACLVVNAKSAATGPKELKGSCIAIPRGSKAHCEMFLERTRESLPAGDCCPMKPAGQTPEETLCAVARGECEAALVDVASLLALEKNLPGAHKRLKVLMRSEELPSAVIVYRKGALSEADVNRVRTGLLECVKTPIGQTFAMFWQLKGFHDYTPEYNKTVEQCLKAYPPPGTKVVQAPQVGGPK